MSREASLYKRISRGSRVVLDADAKVRVRNKLMYEIYLDSEKSKNKGFMASLKSFTLMPYLVLPILVIFIGVASTIYASSSALPGDLFYVVKRATENSRMAFAPNDEARIGLQIKYAEERLQELEAVQSSNVKLKEDAPVVEIPKSVNQEPKQEQPPFVFMKPVFEKSAVEKMAHKEVTKALENLIQTKNELNARGGDSETSNVVSKTIEKLVSVDTESLKKIVEEMSEPKVETQTLPVVTPTETKLEEKLNEDNPLENKETEEVTPPVVIPPVVIPAPEITDEKNEESPATETETPEVKEEPKEEVKEEPTVVEPAPAPASPPASEPQTGAPDSEVIPPPSPTPPPAAEGAPVSAE